VYTSPSSECVALLRFLFIDKIQGLDYLALGHTQGLFFDHATRFLRHLLAGSGNTMGPMHLAVHILGPFQVFWISIKWPCTILPAKLPALPLTAFKCVHFTKREFSNFSRAPYILLVNFTGSSSRMSVLS
jgi:hypothetical protein